MTEQELQALAAKEGINVEELRALLKRGKAQTSDLRLRLTKLEAFMGRSMSATKPTHSVNRDKASADAYNKKVADWKAYTKQRAALNNVRRLTEEGNQLNDMITHMHDATDTAGKIGSAALIAGTMPGVIPAYESTAMVVPLAINYLGAGWRAWNMAHPVASNVLNALFTGTAIGTMASPEGLPKTENLYSNGQYARGTVSLAGDLWNGMAAAYGLNNMATTFGPMLKEAIDVPSLSLLNPFVKTTTTVPGKPIMTMSDGGINLLALIAAKLSLDSEIQTLTTQRDLALSSMAESGNLVGALKIVAVYNSKMLDAWNRYNQAIASIAPQDASVNFIPGIPVLNTSYSLNFKLPYAALPYGIPLYLPETTIPGTVAGTSTKMYAPPTRITGLNGGQGGRGVWMGTTTPSPVRESGMSGHGNYRGPAGDPAVVSPTPTGVVPVPPALWLPDPAYSPEPFIEPGPPSWSVIPDPSYHPTYFSREIHDPDFEKWWRANYKEGTTGIYKGKSYLFKKGNVWRNDATNGGSVSPSYSRTDDTGNYQYNIIDNYGNYTTEDTTNWTNNKSKAESIKKSAKDSGVTKTRKKQ